jgi:vacuolar iron transporter family protein
MPQTLHVEKHFTASEVVRDIVIGMSDGLTVPFALAAGLAGAIQKTHIIVVAGIAEIAAGSIAMGLGGYLAAKSDAEHYDSEFKREHREIHEIPDEEAREVAEVLEAYGMTQAESTPVVNALRNRPNDWVDFMMRFELGLDKPDPKRALNSAATIASSYVVGGLIPLSPYMMMRDQAHAAFFVSVLVTLIALGIFGYVKGRFTGTRPGRSSLQTVVIGGLAAAAAFAIAKLIS